VDAVVEAGRLHGHTDGEEGIHLVVLLGHAIELGVALGEVLRAADVHEDMREHPDGVRVPSHHHV
jgi:hypothetical protein